MSQIKLTADSGGGTTSLKAPSSTTSNADVVLKLPVADGSANQVLKTDGSGQLSFTSNAGTTINNNADNRIITGSGTASTLNGESNLTFDGSLLTVTNTGSPAAHIGGSVYYLKIGQTSTSGSPRIDAIGSNVAIPFDLNGSEKMRIDSSGSLLVGATSYGGGGDVPALYVSSTSGRQVKIHNTNANTTSLQLSNSSTGEGDDAGMMFAALGNSGDGWINNAENAAIRFGTNGTERMRILAGGGLTFNGDTAAANALDDYEEGTYTPTLIYQNTSGLTLSTNSAAGKYTKIGNVCYVLGYINWDVSGSPINDNVGFGGLPFVTNNGEITAGNTRLIWNVTLYNTNAQNVTHQLQPYGTSAVSLSLESEQGNRSNELGSGSGFQARWQGWYFTE